MKLAGRSAAAAAAGNQRCDPVRSAGRAARFWIRFWLVAGLAFLGCAWGGRPAQARPLSPTAVVVAKDGARVFVACATADQVWVLDAAGNLRQRIALPGPPSGLALSPDEATLAVTCAAPQSIVCFVDVATAKVAARCATGHGALAPVFSPDGRFLYVCNRFNHDVAILDVARRKDIFRIPVRREPVAAALSADGRRLFVANHLQDGAADAAQVAAVVSVVDPVAGRALDALRLPNGAGLVRGIALSPDGRYVAVAHNLARYFVPTTQLERGWMNTAALTLIEAGGGQVLNTVLLDNLEAGAANPWAVAWSADGRRIVVTHAGTHELSVIDAPALLAKLAQLPEALPAGRAPDYTKASNIRADVPNDLAFLLGLRQRIKLAGNGPRGLALAGATAWVPGYFSDSLEQVDLDAPGAKPRFGALQPVEAESPARRGERYFNDAMLCFQQWQSCASCHSSDARVDALNWDLLNDGLGNPKNAKSLLWAHRTPPAMSMGVRESAEIAVRSGLRYILFSPAGGEVPACLDEYLKSLQPEPSPLLVNGRLSAAARRGRTLFQDARVGCATCHPGPRFTDLRSYDVGTAGREVQLDTPTLVELWRTAPYLHDGSAPALRDVLKARNARDQHGRTSHLDEAQLADLAAYVLSL